MNIIKWLVGIFTDPWVEAYKMASSTGAPVAPDTPGIQCMSTIFGLNYDGSIDRTDNGQGAFKDPSTGKPYDTRNKNLVGVSIPIPFFEKTPHMSRADIENGVVTVTIKTPKGVVYPGLKIVDLGPGEGGCLIKDRDGVPHLLDRTYGLCQLMESTDNMILTYWILKDGVPYSIAGLDTPYKIV